jgi:hypothetical protein
MSSLSWKEATSNVDRELVEAEKNFIEALQASMKPTKIEW